MNHSNKRIEGFDYIKTVCVVMVILHHCIDNYVSIASSNKLLSLIMVFLHTCHVPTFLIVSGYFCHEQPVKQFYLKKIKQLLIPFFVFSILKLLYSTFISKEFSHGGETIISQIVYSFLIGRQYWFIYTIFIIFCFAPLLWTKSEQKKSHGATALIISFFITCFFTIAKLYMGFLLPEYMQIDHVIYYFPYFAFGCFIRQNKKIMNRLYSEHRGMTYIISVCFDVLFMIIYANYPQIRIHPIRFFVAISFFNILYMSVGGIKGTRIFVRSISKYSLQIMFLDGFYRTVMFTGFKRIGFIAPTLIIIISVLVLLLSVVTCMFLEKAVYIKKLVGL